MELEMIGLRKKFPEFLQITKLNKETLWKICLDAAVYPSGNIYMSIIMYTWCMYIL